MLSSHGVLGRGTRRYLESQSHLKPLENNEMGLNFAGATWATQFIFSTMIKTTYTKHPEAQDELVRLYAEDVKELLFEGITKRDGSIKVHLVHIGTKGDLPALVRLGGFERSFSHVPRQSSSRTPCKGICHLCLAGVEMGHEYDRSIPFEDMLPTALWIETLHTSVAWSSPPTILDGLPLLEKYAIEFFLTDLWHNFHLGVSKSFVGSAWVSIIEANMDCLRGSVETKFSQLTSMYLEFFRSQGKTPLITEISRETMGFPMGSVCPVAKWSKGQASTEMMLFLDHWCKQYSVNKTDDPLLLAIVSPLSFSMYTFCKLSENLCIKGVGFFCSLHTFPPTSLLPLRLRVPVSSTRPLLHNMAQGTGFEARKRLGWEA